ncbi:MAG: T9SS C-terminal target domain-containing protein [Haliscomenobacteraceae bacterium CHB4]|nr:T9SS C-terminal target domain-containing protein [Haliscomenobacteraceae bacterium CHB4]
MTTTASREQNNQLDPRVKEGSAAYSSLAAYPNDPFFTAVNYKGAFDNCYSDMWLAGWTALEQNSHLAPAPATDCVVGTEDLDNSLVSIFRIFPNPAHNMFIVESQFDREVSIEIFDMSGRLVSNLNSIPTGQHRVEINTLVPGMYVIKFRTEEGKVIAKKLIVE